MVQDLHLRVSIFRAPAGNLGKLRPSASRRLRDGADGEDGLEAYAPDGVLLYQNNGLGSGQEVPHFHLHVVPRTPTSDWGLGPPHIARLEAARPSHLDYATVTERKAQTVETLRQYFRS